MVGSYSTTIWWGHIQQQYGRAILNSNMVEPYSTTIWCSHIEPQYGANILYNQSRRGFSRWGALCARVAAAVTVCGKCMRAKLTREGVLFQFYFFPKSVRAHMHGQGHVLSAK